MALVQKLNVVLTVEDDLINTYLNKGYNIIDEYGRVIQEAMPDDPNQLKLMVAKYKKENEELKAKIEELTAKSEKPKIEVEEKPVEVIEPTPIEEEIKEEEVKVTPQRKPKKSSNKK